MFIPPPPSNGPTKKDASDQAQTGPIKKSPTGINAFTAKAYTALAIGFGLSISIPISFFVIVNGIPDYRTAAFVSLPLSSFFCILALIAYARAFHQSLKGWGSRDKVFHGLSHR